MHVTKGGRPAAALAAGILYLSLHLPFLAPSLEDLDSVNFALGLRDFDVVHHQPHPPGYPVYISLGRASLAVISAVAPALDPTRREALALAVWSAVGGAVALIAAAALFGALWRAAGRIREAETAWATAVLATVPLFWMSGLRPLSDMPGVAAALVAQALLLRTSARAVLAGALAAGLSVGVRSQCLWLTGPIFAVVLFRAARRGSVAAVVQPLAAFAAGVLLWAVPLVIASGGPAAYLDSVSAQAADDLSTRELVAANPTARGIAAAAYHTFVLPWASTPVAAVVLAAAVIGAWTLRRSPHTWRMLAILFGPYALWHLLFQHTSNVRYALPLLPVLALLAVRGFSVTGRAAPWAIGAVAAASLGVAVPAAVRYGLESHPAFRAVAEAADRMPTDTPARVFAHYGVWHALRPYADVLPPVESRHRFEWLGPAAYWRGGGTGVVWFLASPHRTDLALIDPRSRRDVERYRWTVGARPELAGARPVGLDWYRLAPPAWFVGEGWSLTPETAGLANATHKGLAHGPIEAFVRRQRGPMHLLLGGWHLGTTADPEATVSVALDDVVIDRFVAPNGRRFVRFVDLPDGIDAGEDAYARLTVTASSDGRQGGVPVAIRQFDVQPATHLIWAFADGWHEQELDPGTGRQWRWTSERSALGVHGRPRTVRLTLRGESPLRYFPEAPTVRVSAGGRHIASFSPDRDFEWQVTIPAADLARHGVIVVETDRIYRPGQVEGTADERRLGLRIWDCRVEAIEDTPEPRLAQSAPLLRHSPDGRTVDLAAK